MTDPCSTNPSVSVLQDCRLEMLNGETAMGYRYDCFSNRNNLTEPL